MSGARQTPQRVEGRRRVSIPASDGFVLPGISSESAAFLLEEDELDAFTSTDKYNASSPPHSSSIRADQRTIVDAAARDADVDVQKLMSNNAIAMRAALREQQLLEELKALQDTIDTLGQTLLDSEQERSTMAHQLTEAVEATNSLMANFGVTPGSSTVGDDGAPGRRAAASEQSRASGHTGEDSALSNSASAATAAELHRAVEKVARLRRENDELRERLDGAERYAGQLENEVDFWRGELERTKRSEPGDTSSNPRASRASAAASSSSPLRGHSQSEPRSEFGGSSSSAAEDAAPPPEVAAQDGGALNWYRQELKRQQQVLVATREKFNQVLHFRTTQLNHVVKMLHTTKQANINVLSRVLSQLNVAPTAALAPSLAAPSQLNNYRHHHHVTGTSQNADGAGGGSAGQPQARTQFGAQRRTAIANSSSSSSNHANKTAEPLSRAKSAGLPRESVGGAVPALSRTATFGVATRPKPAPKKRWM